MLLLFLGIGCIDKYEDSGYTSDLFCDEFSEAGTINLLDGGATGSNGRLEAQLVTEADNARDSSIIGNATYILESLDVGGGERLGQAGPLGDIQITLGEGNWSMRLEGVTGCSHELEFMIEAEKTLEMCLPLYCDG